MYTVQDIHGHPLKHSDGHQAVEVCNESTDGKLNWIHHQIQKWLDLIDLTWLD